jgi:hypothetical protein
MRRRFKQPEPVVLEAALGAEGLLGGQPAFGADGALLGLAQEAEAGKRSLEELGSFYMGNSSLLPSKVRALQSAQLNGFFRCVPVLTSGACQC